MRHTPTQNLGEHHPLPPLQNWLIDWLIDNGLGQLAVDVGMLDTMENDLADVLSVSPLSEQLFISQFHNHVQCSL